MDRYSISGRSASLILRHGRGPPTWPDSLSSGREMVAAADDSVYP